VHRIRGVENKISPDGYCCVYPVLEALIIRVAVEGFENVLTARKHQDFILEPPFRCIEDDASLLSFPCDMGCPMAVRYHKYSSAAFNDPDDLLA
jgi:hypothetical protein